MKIILEKNKVPHQAGMTAETERFEIPMPEGMPRDVALFRVWSVAEALLWTTASLADWPPVCYISKDGLYCIYLEEDKSPKPIP